MAPKSSPRPKPRSSTQRNKDATMRFGMAMAKDASRRNETRRTAKKPRGGR